MTNFPPSFNIRGNPTSENPKLEEHRTLNIELRKVQPTTDQVHVSRIAFPLIRIFLNPFDDFRLPFGPVLPVIFLEVKLQQVLGILGLGMLRVARDLDQQR